MRLTAEQIAAIQADPALLAEHVDYTILKPCTQEEVDAVCETAIKLGYASVCVRPFWLKYVVAKLEGTGVKPCVVIGFSDGDYTPQMLRQQTVRMVQAGAQELDMVVNLFAYRMGSMDLVRQSIRAVVDAAGEATVKVILRTNELEPHEIIELAQLVENCEADYVKTCTGFDKSGGATLEAAHIMMSAVSEKMDGKASAGIRTFADAIKYLRTGVIRIGASADLVGNELDRRAA